MSLQIFDFDESLKMGKSGEDLFHSYFPYLKRTSGLDYDFESENGCKIELKSDSYDLNKYPNFFMERYSWGDRPGGPWQSLFKGATHYVYFYVKNETFFTFEVRKLVEALEFITEPKHLIEVRNRDHLTRGFKIPRESLNGIYKIGKAPKKEA